MCCVSVSNSNSANSISSVNSAPGGAAASGDSYDTTTEYFKGRLKTLCEKMGMTDSENNGTEKSSVEHEPLRSTLLSQVQAQDSDSNSSLSSTSSLGASLVRNHFNSLRFHLFLENTQ